MATPLMNVRFEGNNGNDADVMRCLLLSDFVDLVGLARRRLP
jgi:hypothetical protein